MEIISSSTASNPFKSRLLWVVRHGEREDNINPGWRAALSHGQWDDPPLSARGLLQAEEVGQRLALSGQPVHFLVCSPFSRCLQTARQILNKMEAAGNGRPLPAVLIEPGFCESLSVCQNPPGFPGMDQIRRSFPEMPIDLNYQPFLSADVLPKDEKTNLCCFQRVIGTLKHTIRKLPGNLLLVTHGSPITAIHFALTGKLDYMGQCTISHYRLATIGEASTNDDKKNNGSQEKREEQFSNNENKNDTWEPTDGNAPLAGAIDANNNDESGQHWAHSRAIMALSRLTRSREVTTSSCHRNGHNSQQQQQQDLLALAELDGNKARDGEQQRHCIIVASSSGKFVFRNGNEEERQLLALAVHRLAKAADEQCRNWGMRAECLAAGCAEHLTDKRNLHTVLHI